MTKSKRARQREQASSPKTPGATEDPDFWGSNPSWQIGILQTKGPFGWGVLDEAALHKIRERLANLETMTWREILIKSKKQHHTIRVAALPGENQKRLREIGQHDVDRLVSLRVSSRERIFGILDKAVLRLLWWDPEHQVYPSSKRRT